MHIYIEKEIQTDFSFDESEVIEAVLKKSQEIFSIPFEFEVNVLLTDNEGIRGINKETRGIDAPTDVLSFPMLELESPAVFPDLSELSDSVDPETNEVVLGDIVISVAKVRVQAKEYGHSERRELAFLVAHSVCHLVGYDHIDCDPKPMEDKQEEILRSLGITRENS